MQCFVCFRSFAEVQPTILTCGHSLCGECVEVTLSRNPVCPTCNKPELRALTDLPLNSQLQDLAKWSVSLSGEQPYLLSTASPTFTEEFLIEG